MIEKGFTIEQPPHGYVRYIEHLGTDMRIVEAARVSYKSPSKGEELDKKLLGFLYRSRHTTPFEQPNITFNIKMPIFIMRQFVRQRMFRLNEFSGRYSEMPDEFFTPETWRFQDNKDKQGSYAPTVKDSREQAWQQGNSEIYHNSNAVAYLNYKALLKRGVAKEQSRMVLPLSIYTEIYVSVDLHNLMNFLDRRLDAHAQREIQDLAQAMFEIAEALFPWTFEAFKQWKHMMLTPDEVQLIDRHRAERLLQRTKVATLQ